MKKFVFVALFLLFSPLAVTYANSPDITAPIAVVMCYDTGEILYERNMEQRWIPASMTKIMTAFIVYEEIAAGNLTHDTLVTVSANASRFSNDRRVEGTFVPLRSGAEITVETLLRLVMLPSGNAAAMVLAEHISGTEAAFVERMNETAVDLGMYSSFTNSHGAFAHHSNAYSIAILIREFIQRHPDILRITAMPSMQFSGNTYNNTNRLLSTHPFEGADGFKTGTIRAAGWGHSTTALRDGRRVIAVLMNTRNNDTRQNESRILLQFGFDELARRDQAAADRVRVFSGNTILQLNAPAVVQGNQLFLPLADMLRPLGFELSWNDEYRVVTITRDGTTSTLFVDRPAAFVNGRPVTLDTAARLIGGRVYVPFDFISQFTDNTPTWDINTGVVRV